MFWKVPGFSQVRWRRRWIIHRKILAIHLTSVPCMAGLQPSPVERVLDKEEFTLDDLLDEDDLIQECKSLNGRLIAL